MADLDADNIINRLSNNTPLPEVINAYYEEHPYGNGRAKEFLENNSIEDVQNAILNRAGISPPNTLEVVNDAIIAGEMLSKPLVCFKGQVAKLV